MSKGSINQVAVDAQKRGESLVNGKCSASVQHFIADYHDHRYFHVGGDGKWERGTTEHPLCVESVWGCRGSTGRVWGCLREHGDTGKATTGFSSFSFLFFFFFL